MHMIMVSRGLLGVIIILVNARVGRMGRCLIMLSACEHALDYGEHVQYWRHIISHRLGERV